MNISPRTDQTPTGRQDYQWTPRRIAAAIAIVAVFGIFAAVYIQSQVRKMPPASGSRSRAPNPQFDLSNLQIDEQMILSGGPPADGIPGLRTEAAPRSESARPSRNEGRHDARIVGADDADFLALDSRVLGLAIDGEARAYPVDVLIYHEIVNDQLGDVPVGVIYCPLCDSFSVVDRRIDGDVLEFGTSGMLTDSNVLLYDRRDHALWSQLHFKAISGPLAGHSLEHINQWQITTFGRWVQQHPQTTVVSTETGHERPYDQSPYAGYFERDDIMFPVDHTDTRMANKTPVIGIVHDDTARAYVVAAIDGELTDTINGQAFHVRFDAEANHLQIVDAPDGAKVIYTFWFAWAAFHPQTEVVGLSDAEQAAAATQPAAP